VARTTPRVSNGVLVDPVGAPGRTVGVGSEAWRRWLDDARTTTFRFVHHAGSFTARKEQRQRGSSYWYAYRTRGGRLHKSYLGRPEDLTLPRLMEVAARLAGGPPEPIDEPAATRGDESLPRPPTPALGTELPPDTGPPPDALLTTKLYMPPARPNWVRRPRLTDRLSAGLRGPLTLIVAPAGFGKTTLLGDWRAASPEGGHDNAARWPLAWLALDAGDNDLARFLRYVIAALRPLHAGLGASVLASLRSPQPPPVEILLTPLLNDLMTLPSDVILVLDDYHVVEAPAIHQAVAFLLDHLPPRVHLVLATRANPPLPLARLRARGGLTELRAADLRFTADEAAAFLTSAMGAPLSADDVAMLGARTEGWIAGLQLAALALQGRDPAHLADAIAALTGAHRYILDYLADEVFDQQPEEVRRFLLRTSVLDHLSGPLCDALAGDGGHTLTMDGGHTLTMDEGQVMLERLEAANLFLVPLDDTRTWYRYHHLFGDFLRKRLRREQPALTPDLHRQACRWYEGQGLLAEAADHALAAHDHALAARLVERVSPTLLYQRGELATLRHWLERLPRDATRTHPRLSLDLAWASLLGGHVDAVAPRLQDAEQALDTSDTPDTPDTLGIAAPPSAKPAESGSNAGNRALRGEIAAIRTELARLQGKSAAAIDLARQALADLPLDERRVRGATTAFLGSAYLSHGDAAAASLAYGEAVALSQTPATITLALFASGRLVLAQALHGQPHQAAATYRRTLDLAASHGMAAPPAIGAAQVGMGEALREWNDLDGADDLLRRGITHCRGANGMAQMALEGSLTLARVLQSRGNPEDALAVLEQARAHAHDHHVAQSAERLAVARARLWLTATPGDVATARRWADARAAAWQTDVDEPPDYVGLLERLTLARLREAQGRHAEAAALLRTLLGRTEAGGLTGCVIEILALQARLALEQDHLAQAMIALIRALTLAEPEGYVRVFVDEGAPMVTLLRYARARGVAPDYVDVLLAACGSGPWAQTTSPAASVARALIEPLSVRELEVLRLLAAGLSTPEIAAQLFITAGTTRIHLKHIYRKLDAHSRLQAVERARGLNLL